MPSNFGFVIEGVLAGMERPGSYAALQADLAFLKENGIRAIVSLTESPLDTQAVEAAGFAYLHVPVGDFRAPSIEQVDRFVAFQETHEKEGAAVVVHCGAGRGRTGTMLACALVKRGMGAEEALRKLREIRPHSVETPEQEDLVQRYEVRLARRRKHGA